MKRFLLMLSLVSVVVLAGAPSLRAADPRLETRQCPSGSLHRASEPRSTSATAMITWPPSGPGSVSIPTAMSGVPGIWATDGGRIPTGIGSGPITAGRGCPISTGAGCPSTTAAGAWDNDCGWFWTPGTVWGPAWVTWRWSDLYFGWAPIPPGFDFRPGIDFDAVALGIPLNFWVFVGGSHFLDRDIRRDVLPYERNTTIVRDTTIRNNFEFRGDRMVNDGIDPETIRRVTGHRVLRYSLADSDRPGALAGRRAGRRASIGRRSGRSRAPGRKQFLNRDQARRELAPARIFEPQPQHAGRVAGVRRPEKPGRAAIPADAEPGRGTKEPRAPSRSGSPADDGAPTRGPRVQQDYQARMAEQRKQHQAEQQRMNERHRQEAEQVRQSGQSKQRAAAAPEEEIAGPWRDAGSAKGGTDEKARTSLGIDRRRASRPFSSSRSPPAPGRRRRPSSSS